MKNALSVDLEEYFQVSNFAGVIDRDNWPALPSRVVDATHRLLDTFDRTDSRATFFVLGWVAKRQPSLVREIAERGHEIACHGYGHELVYEIGPERFRDDLKRARSAIADATGLQPRGYRAPSYSITRQSLWALDILSEEGFDYDSSIFPIRHHRYGIPDFSRTPVRIGLADGRSIREFPMTTIAAGPLKLPLAGGAYLRFFPPALFRWGFRRLIKAGEPIVLYVHPWEIDPGQPRQQVGWKVRVNHYYNLGRTEGRLLGLLKEFCFRPLEAVLGELEAESGLPGYRF
jgi:polysaccharide deacetylase family protein (PEP-CTERM system associated)